MKALTLKEQFLHKACDIASKIRSSQSMKPSLMWYTNWVVANLTRWTECFTYLWDIVHTCSKISDLRNRSNPAALLVYTRLKSFHIEFSNISLTAEKTKKASSFLTSKTMAAKKKSVTWLPPTWWPTDGVFSGGLRWWGLTPGQQACGVNCKKSVSRMAWTPDTPASLEESQARAHCSLVDF